ncbi:hypothetical protein AB0M47_17125 [Hamadaea sp. NPDC051192]|uniref:hypothetical protein n=1 Tax=Hamadaea sp. NPDC051192 TaxID=3154940 RepID=UPI00344AF43B
MTDDRVKPLLLDTSALRAIGQVQWLSTLLNQAHFRPDRPVLAPVVCLAYAGRDRPHLIKHVGQLPAVSVIPFDFGDALSYEEWRAGQGWQKPDLDVAHAASAALPGPEYPGGAAIITDSPQLYLAWPEIKTRRLES